MTLIEEQIDTFTIDWDGARCDFSHSHRVVPERFRSCLLDATHTVTSECGREEVYLCNHAAAAVDIVMRAQRAVRCSKCGKAPANHWVLRPL